jgi:uncharacterized protein
MPGTSLLALLDDISSVLDDVAVLTKTASAQTAGVLGDDLALNAEQVSGVSAERELPVVWAVARGSLLNKAILIPAALLLSALTPWLVPPLLLVGGGYLCVEGAEKVLHAWLHARQPSATSGANAKQLLDSHAAARQSKSESQKVKGAIRTDFVLSAEIVTIALGVVSHAPLLTRFLVLLTVGIAMTIGVYGIVAIIVKLDDMGRHLCQKSPKSRLRRVVGMGLLHTAPRLMKALTVVGTLAMFLVGGGIIAHGAHFVSHLKFLVVSHVAALGSFGLNAANAVFNACVGAFLGLVLWLGVKSIEVLRRRQRRAGGH